MSDSYLAPLQHFADAKVLGVTATPDRLDEERLGEVFEHVAYVYDMRDAIEDGWLVDIVQQQILVQGLDLSRCRVTAGDLNEGDLEKILTEEEHLHQVAVPTLEAAGTRPTLVFCVTVAHAKLLAEVFNRYRPGCAHSLDGKTCSEERTRTLQDFAQGRLQILTNCALFTEGIDIPIVSCVAMARPTKSRALYSQSVGRGTRLSPGKTDLLVLDFVGNSGRHKLVTVVDIFGAEKDPDVAAAVAQLAQAQPGAAVRDLTDTAARQVAAQRRAADLDRQQELLARQAEIAARRHVQVGVRYQQQTVDPFAWAGISSEKNWDGFRQQGPDPETAALLERHGISPHDLNAPQARALRRAIHARVVKGLATYKQTRALWKFGIDASAWSFARASAALDQIAGWQWRPTPDQLAALTMSLPTERNPV